MSVKKTGVFLLVLLLLGVFYYYYEIKGKAEREKAKAEAEKIFSLSQDQVTGVVLTKDDAKPIHVIKADKSWRITDPIQDEGDYQANEQLLSTLLEATRERVVEEKNPDLEAFGLKDPSLKVTLLTDDTPTATLLVGAQNPTRTGYYAKREDDPTLFLVSTFLKENIDKNLFDLRDKTVISWATDRVTGLEISTPALHLVAEGEGDEWKITSPLNAKADGEKIRAFLDQLRSAKVKEFVEETPTDLAQYGLEPAAKTVTLFLGQDKRAKTLLFGEKAQDKQMVYAKRQKEAPVFLVETRVPEALPTQVADWRDRTVLAFEKENIDKIEIASPEETVIVTKETDGTWKLVQPVEAQADQGKINTFLWDLYGLKVEEFVAENAENLAIYGLQTPTRSIRLWEKGKDAPLTLLIGSKAEGKEGSYAKVESQNPIYLLAPKDVASLAKSAADLQEQKSS